VSEAEPRADRSGPTDSAPASRRLWLRLVLLVVGFAVAGVFAGVLWEALWSPPGGIVVDSVWYLDNEGVEEDFSGTGLYVLVGLATGLLMGVLSAVTAARTHEVATLVAVAVGSSVAAALMAVTGHALGPPDPRPLAEGREDLTEIPSDLRVVGTTPYAALPAGALTGLAVCFVGLGRSVRNHD
jgi:hypothetical protein